MNIRKLGWRRKSLMLLAAGAVVCGISWFRQPADVPVSLETKLAGQSLFVHEWQPDDPRAHGDGLGPVFNAKSCVACHFQGGVGGGGDNRQNVTSYEIHPNLRDPQLQTGLVHAFAVNASYKEDHEVLKQCFPIVKGGERLIGGCQVKIEDFDPIRVETTNSIALFGDGLIDRISHQSITYSHTRRALSQISQEIGGNFHSIDPGRPRILSDGRVGKFGWKAQFATLREFVAAACANELGLGNPLMDQARPLGSDYPCPEEDLSSKEFLELVAFVDTLPRPTRVLPEDSVERAHAVRGEALFTSIGCAACHTPDLGEVAGIYSDLLLHSIAPKFHDGYRHEVLVEVPLPASHPRPDEWRTPPLWGVADSAPYFHDGATATLGEAILRHDGGAATVTKAFKELPPNDQQALIAFLETLKAPMEALPAQQYLCEDSVILIAGDKANK